MRRILASACAAVLGLSCVSSASAQTGFVVDVPINRAQLNAGRKLGTIKPTDLAVTDITVQQQGALTAVFVTVQNKGSVPSRNCSLQLDIAPSGQAAFGESMTIPSLSGGQNRTFTFAFQGSARRLAIDAL